MIFGTLVVVLDGLRLALDDGYLQSETGYVKFKRDRAWSWDFMRSGFRFRPQMFEGTE